MKYYHEGYVIFDKHTQSYYCETSNKDECWEPSILMAMFFDLLIDAETKRIENDWGSCTIRNAKLTYEYTERSIDE